ncbi:MAG: O-antigen ligase family protein [Campylobacterales bacterium]|nr:O-antigen ligase family protein [Campylobacterales bacterium]
MRINQSKVTDVLNGLFFLYALSVPLSRAGIVVFSFLIILVWLFLSQDRRLQMKRVFENRAVQALFIYIFYCFIALLWVESDNLLLALKAFSKYWYFMVIPIIVVQVKQKYIIPLIAAFLTGVVISAILSYGIFFELISMKHGSVDDPTPIMRHLDFGLFLAFSALILLTRFLYEINLKYKLLYGMLFIVVATDIFIIGGRIGYVIFIPTLLLLILYRFEQRLRAFLIASLLLGTVLVGAYNFSPPFKHRADMTIESMGKLYSEQNYCTSWGMRAGAFVVAQDIIKDNPLLGVGNRDHIERLQEIISTKYPTMECLSWFMHYHNQYLEIITQSGAIGLLLFLSIFYFLIRMKFQSKEFEALKIIFISVYLIGFIAEPYLSAKQFPMAMFALFFALLHAYYQFENSTNDTSHPAA